MTDPDDPLRAAATLLGAKGGAAGKGSKKRRNKTTLTPKTARKLAASRPPESQKREVDYAALGRRSAEARAKKKGTGAS
jgi:hypothetical protein